VAWYWWVVLVAFVVWVVAPAVLIWTHYRGWWGFEERDHD